MKRYGCFLIFFVILFNLSLPKLGANLVADPQKHPIYTRLLQLQPKLDKSLAMSISNEIYRCHKKIGLDKYLLVAMYNQESRINYRAKNCQKGILEKEALDKIVSLLNLNENNVFFNVEKLRKELKQIPLKMCFDLGLSQINVNTALKYEICDDLERLVTDYQYNISCSCKVLEGIQRRYALRDEFWWTRYNASSPKKREIYKQLVMEFYPKKELKVMNENISQSSQKIHKRL